MTKNTIEAYRACLGELLKELDTDAAQNPDARRTVELDQQSVGRLSRMDAMQQQAMAKATARRRGDLRARLLAALNRLDTGEFGICLDCGEDIAPKRLAHDPAVALCITCAR